MSLVRALTAMTVGLCLSFGATVVTAQDSTSPNKGPFKATAQPNGPPLMLEGHDAVAYFTQSAAIKGDPAITAEHMGVVYNFASEGNRKLFIEAPEKYMPQFGGFCANGINYAIPWGGGGAKDTWRIYRGKLYVFGGQKPRDHFEMETEVNLERAHRYWNEEVAGSTPLFVRAKRLTFRVPHYKTDAALQAEYEAALAAGTLPVKPGAAQVVSRN